MNKLVLTLTFGVLASSAFANNYLETNAEHAHHALRSALASGNMSKDLEMAKPWVKNEYKQRDLMHDLKVAVEMARKSDLSKKEIKAALKHAYKTDYQPHHTA